MIEAALLEWHSQQCMLKQCRLKLIATLDTALSMSYSPHLHSGKGGRWGDRVRLKGMGGQVTMRELHSSDL